VLAISISNKYKMVTRRKFIANSTIGIAGFGLTKNVFSNTHFSEKSIPVVISTWKHGAPANNKAWEILSSGGYALDAVEAGVRVTEADPNVHTVGKGGFPDAKGKITLDAGIMNEKGDAGSVAYLQKIMHPISVARLVMEKTPHVMLVGKGAQRFALQNGFEKEKLLTKKIKKTWREWKKKEKEFNSVLNIENLINQNHDTIGMLAVDENGRICGACTSSGMAFKMQGRVGDSPIIGAGLYIDGEIGGAVATGTGELVMKTLGSFLIVEMMRNGMSPQRACEEAVRRIVKKNPDYESYQIGYVALAKNGTFGAFSLQPGFDFAIKNNNGSELTEADSWLKKL
jgi:isoaspartyl peptidase/L-asparaginase-like protein (Ntn-hydrolase superfamily)